MGLFSNMIDAIVRVFGEPGVTFIPTGGDPVSVNAVFTETGEEVTPGGTVVTVSRPRLFVDVRDLARLPRTGDWFVVRTEKYRVTNFVKDGEGGGVAEVQIDAQ